MAFGVPILDFTFEAAADMTAAQYKFVMVDATGKVAIATAGAAAIGTIQNEPDVGEGAAIRVQGIAQVVAGAAITPGNKISSNATGQGVVASSSYVVGIALTAASGAGAVFSMLVTHEGA